MINRMIITFINDYERLKKFEKSNLVRIFFNRRDTAVFYMSHKQYKKLVQMFEKQHYSRVKADVIAVFDNDRFVWSGIEYSDYSDREWLMKNFKAEWSDDYIVEQTETIEHHIPKKINKNDFNNNSLKELIR